MRNPQTLTFTYTMTQPIMAHVTRKAHMANSWELEGFAPEMKISLTMVSIW